MQSSALGFATLDHHREQRCGEPEVVFAAGKTAQQVGRISESLLTTHDSVLVTRASTEQIDELGSVSTDILTHRTSSQLLHIREGEVSGEFGVP